MPDLQSPATDRAPIANMPARASESVSTNEMGSALTRPGPGPEFLVPLARDMISFLSLEIGDYILSPLPCVRTKTQRMPMVPSLGRIQAAAHH